MSTPQTEIRTPEDMFAYDLAAVYDMELKLVDALNEMSRTVTNDDLGAGFAIHATETERQVEYAEAAFEALGREPTRRDNRLVDALLEENARFDAAVRDDELRNLHYLTAAVKTERVEITEYEGLLATAEKAGLADEVTAPLEGSLGQEEKTLRKLLRLARGPGSVFETLRDGLTDR